MALALQLIIYPAALVIVIIIIGLADSFSPGALALGLFFILFVAGIGFNAIRFAFRVDKEAGVDHAPD